MRTSLATQKPVFQIPFFSPPTASLSRDLISPFLANYFFLLSFSRPPGGMAQQKNSFTLLWVACRPYPTFCSEQHLSNRGTRASGGAHRRLHPLSQRSGSPFHPASSPPSGTPGRTSHHRHTVPGRVSFLRSHTGSRLTRYVLRFHLVGGVSSEHTACAVTCSVTAHRLATQI